MELGRTPPVATRGTTPNQDNDDKIPDLGSFINASPFWSMNGARCNDSGWQCRTLLGCHGRGGGGKP